MTYEEKTEKKTQTNEKRTGQLRLKEIHKQKKHIRCGNRPNDEDGSRLELDQAALTNRDEVGEEGKPFRASHRSTPHLASFRSAPSGGGEHTRLPRDPT